MHPEILKSENVPAMRPGGPTVWQARYRSIVDLERHLRENGTRIVKFYLHLSKGEQRKRFLERIDERDENWKFSLSDCHERKFWRHYMKAYADCLGATSSADSPWYVVLADEQETSRPIVSQVLLETLHGLDMAYPTPDSQQQRRMHHIRMRLAR